MAPSLQPDRAGGPGRADLRAGALLADATLARAPRAKPIVAPDGAAFRSSVAKHLTDIVRDDHDGVLSYLLHCERSLGRYLSDALIDAGDEFGIEVEGFVLPESGEMVGPS